MKLVEVQHSAEFLSKTILLQLLCSIIRLVKKFSFVNIFCLTVMPHSEIFLAFLSNGAAESILRSRAMMITGRLLSKENAFALIDESSKLLSLVNGVSWHP